MCLLRLLVEAKRVFPPLLLPVEPEPKTELPVHAEWLETSAQFGNARQHGGIGNVNVCACSSDSNESEDVLAVARFASYNLGTLVRSSAERAPPSPPFHPRPGPDEILTRLTYSGACSIDHSMTS